MVQFIEVSQISGVTLVELKPVDDSRGRFREIFRKEWFPESSWKAVQSNHSLSNEGVLRGLHFHKKQSDYWYILDGQIRAGLVDLRRNSKTFKACLTLDMNQNEPHGLFIPVGVAHGFLAVKKTNLLYIVDNYYDGDDEYGIAWNDPVINLNWGLEKPIVSERDFRNRNFEDIPMEELPL